MNYNFDINDAVQYGVDESIMLANIKYWLRHNKANNKHIYDDDVWTFNSKRAFAELFPFWSEMQVKRILKSLINQGVIKSGNYNTLKYDRTLWYAVTDPQTLEIAIGQCHPMDRVEPANGSGGITQPIPDKKTQIVNTDRDGRELPPEINVDAWNEFMEHRGTGKKKPSTIAKTKLINILKRHSFEDQQYLVDYSITGGYTGIFEDRLEKRNEKSNGNNGHGEKGYIDRLQELSTEH